MIVSVNLAGGWEAKQSKVYVPSHTQEVLWEAVKTWQKENNIKNGHSNFTINMFCKEASPMVGYPKLKGKAIELRAMGPTLLALWRTHLDEGKVQHRTI